MNVDKGQIWQETLSIIKVQVTSAVFSTWLSKTHLASLKKTSSEKYIAEVACLSSFVRATIEARYFQLIQDTLIKVLGVPCDIQFVLGHTDIQFPAVEKSDALSAPLFEQEHDAMFIARLTQSRIRPNQLFDNFAVSGSNQMAWAAAQAVADTPGVSYNPLFIWGGVGVGKTHLMNAVGFNILKKDVNAKVLLCSGEDFTNDIIMGIRNKATQQARDKYRKLNALFIDDIQFIAGKDAIQEEFFHTFNSVTLAGGQIILTSDKPPSSIARLEERLRSRFEAGLIVDIGQPDFELRCAIVQIKSKEKGMDMPMHLTELIAGNIDTARKIEGFLVRLSSEIKLRNTPLSEELVTLLLSRGTGGGMGEIEKRRKQVTPEQLIDAVSLHYSIAKRALMGKARARMVARPRQILMYLLRTELHMPLQDVGRLVGGRDHSTVIHAVDTITQLASKDTRLRDDLLGIKNSL